MKMFRLLNADEIECRVSKITEKGISLLLYKTARTDADLLDETVGPENWENDFKLVDGVLYGGIGIRFGDNMTIWKWDAGTESNTEAEKGRASDAFKRAGFKFGIGRELYSAPNIWIPAEMCNIKTNQSGKRVCNDNFIVTHIAYDEQERIKELKISVKGKTVYELGVTQKQKQEEKKEVPDNKFRCSQCGKVLVPYNDSKGRPVNLRSHAEKSLKKFGSILCLDCISDIKDQEVTE